MKKEEFDLSELIFEMDEDEGEPTRIPEDKIGKEIMREDSLFVKDVKKFIKRLKKRKKKTIRSGWKMIMYCRDCATNVKLRKGKLKLITTGKKDIIVANAERC